MYEEAEEYDAWGNPTSLVEGEDQSSGWSDAVAKGVRAGTETALRVLDIVVSPLDDIVEATQPIAERYIDAAESTAGQTIDAARQVAQSGQEAVRSVVGEAASTFGGVVAVGLLGFGLYLWGRR